MVAVDDGQPFSVEKIPLAEGVECSCEQPRVPAIQEITGDGQMTGLTDGDAIELLLEGDHIAVIAQVQIRQVCEQHALKS